MLQILFLAGAAVVLGLMACGAAALLVMEAGERAGVTKGGQGRG